MTVNRREPMGWLLWAVAVAVISGSVVMVRANPYTTVLGTGTGWEWSAVGAGALAVAAAVTGTRGRRIVIALTALWWFVPEWAGWAAGPAWVRVTASAVGVMLVAATVIAAFEVAGVTGRPRTAVVWPIVVAATVTVVVTFGFVDPFEDPDCWRHCGPNPLLIADLGVADRVVQVAAWCVGVASAAAAVVLLAHIGARARRPAAGSKVVTVIGTASLVVGVGAIGELSSSASLFTATAGALVMAAGVTSERWHAWRMRVALGRLIEDLREAPAPGALAGALAAKLGDPGLQVLYWASARGGHVDAEGRPASLPQSGERAVTAVVRAGGPVATIVHRRDLDPAALERALRPAVRLWLNNDQIRASTLAELAELRASEVRLAERSEQERRRLERNLHDGAQQRVVGIALLLRMLRARHSDLPAPLADRSAALLDTLLDDLRRITDSDPGTRVPVRAEETI